ncbi:ankyrin-1 [Verticillium alfalfae VaMs.102]|uniref:Ankyrin-1 n=1 Tax=Verticillium alfalfae (strain VaMs.102 / ATCC MYA-4576 / FGSC 10136) TaxID=526221 RepID=C9SG08_VERA1|nr:ankyrin-1 [Verticillium alfalfae VaMs.102]EEY17412.1 ankyrin-1 [Verticillium alfalfae VaMs.102]
MPSLGLETVYPAPGTIPSPRWRRTVDCCSDTGGDSEPLLTCVKTTVLLHARQSSRITTNEIKEYVESAKAINLSFTAGLTRELEIVNFTEGITTNIAPDDEPAYMTNIIPKASSALGMGQGITEIMECTHEQMTNFASPVDDCFRRLQERLVDMHAAITQGTTFRPATLPLLPTPKSPRPKSPPSTLPGSRPTSPENPTVAFFCNTHTSHATQPAILDYFIYDLLCRKPEWFDGVPPRYRNRQPPGSRFSHDTLFDILRGIKSTKLSMNTVYFIIDGLDLCDSSFVERLVQQISSLIGKLIIEGIDQTPLPGQVELPRPRFKFLLTLSPNRVPRQTSGFRHIQLAPAVVKADIAVYVDEFFERFTGIIPSQMIRKKKLWVKDESDTFFVAAASHCAELERAEDCRRGGFESYDDICPPPVSQYYDHELLPILQDTSSNNYALLLLMLHISALGPLNMTEMLDAISCLPRPEAQDFLNSKYPFYSYAATRWARHLARSETKGFKLLSKLEDFISDRSQPFQTWCHYKAWSENESESCAGHRVPPCIELAKEDARIMVQHFLSSAQTKPVLERIMDRLLPFGMIDLPRNMLKFAIRRREPLLRCWDDLQDYHGLNILHHACRTDLKAVELLIDAGADASVWCQDKRSPITNAIVRKDFDMFKILLRGISDINMIDGNGVGILHHQLILERPEWLACLLERPGVNLDLMPLKDGELGIPPLAFAAGHGYSTSAEMLLAAGATPGYVPGQAELLPLHYAIQAEGAGDARMTRILLEYGAPLNTLEIHAGWGRRNCPAIVRMLMEHPLPPDPNYIPEHGVHVLIHAVQPGKGAEMTKLLLAYGADTQIFHLPAQAESPLHYAAGDGMADVCQALLDHDPAMINLQDEGSLLIDTPLHRAARAVKPQETIACLLAAGARPESQAYLFMDIPLHQACQKANLEAVKILHAAAPELINYQDFYGHTPLIDACREGAVAVVEFLLHNGADMSQQDHLGDSCVGRIVDQEPGIALRLVRLLLNHGLGINDVVACDGFTVLAEACVVQNMPLVEYLLENGADPIRCQRGPDGTSWRTAVHLVMQRRKPKALDVLLKRQDVRDHMEALDWAAPDTIRWLDRTIHASVLKVVYTHRTLRNHQTAMLDMIDLLLFRGGYDKHTITLFHRLALRVDIVEKSDKYEENTYYNWTCDCCDKAMSVAAKHCMKVCRVCQVSLCDDPECWDVWEPQVHAWITVPFIQDTDLNSTEMQQTLEDLLYAFDPAQDEKRAAARVTTEVGLPSDSESDTTTLSLAVLHAFGLLEIPRKAWGPFLPLSPRLFARLASWDWMLLPTRKRFEESVWAAELKPHRLKRELDYFLTSGRRIALPNEKLVLSQAVLESLATLFEGHGMPERSRQRPGKRYMPRHQPSPDMGPLPPPLIHPRLQTHEPISRWASPLPVTPTPTSPRSVRSFSSVSSFVRD